VILRICTSFAVVLIALNWIDYTGFLNIYLLASFLVLVAILLFNYRLQTFRLSRIQPVVSTEAKLMINFGLTSMVSGSALVLLSYISLFTLKALNGEALVGIYGTFFAIAQVISLPAKALNTTSYQIIADAWKNEDLLKINKIYSKTSIVQLLVGSLILVGLIVNQRSILFLLHKPEFSRYFNVFIIIGVGFLIDITGGLNGAIIGFSRHYKIQSFILISTAIVGFLITFTIVSKFGLLGAAVGYATTMFVLNFGYWAYLKWRFQLQPFGRKHILSLSIALASLVTGIIIPYQNDYYVDVILRSGIVTIVFSSLTYFFKVSEDINDLLNKVLMRKR
jgi:O-antigen/teichoic acid export membrane protein